jgi:hypothetical protein
MVRKMKKMLLYFILFLEKQSAGMLYSEKMAMEDGHLKN